MKLKQLFCKHKNIEYKEPITTYHALNSNPIYQFCVDCGKLLKIEYISNEEYLFRFKVDSSEKSVITISEKELQRALKK